MKKLALVLGVLALSACSSQQISHDPQTMWTEAGKRAAQTGMAKLDKSGLEAKLKGEAVTDEHYQYYLDGFAQGQKNFCDPNKAFDYGMTGQHYMDQCAGMPDEEQFKYNWNRGFEQYLFPFNMN